MSDLEILLVDDDKGSREAMAKALSRVGFEVTALADGAQALELIESGEPVQVLISDMRMPGIDGAELLRRSKALRPDLPFILVTAFGDVDEAVSALKDGADDYLTKPVKMQDLRRRVQLHVDRRLLSDENRRLRQRLRKEFGFEGIIGHSEVMEDLFDRMRRVSPTRSTVLVIGESGTGKELVANAIHENSPRTGNPFIAVNCGAIPGEILESELFGHEKGAFTGAHQKRIGLVEAAAGGTLFLDEISELSPELQVKLLRVLEERKITRVGGTQTMEVDFRLVAATNRDLASWVADGRFRQDLYYRLKVVTLEIPALRQRPDDIPLLIKHFLRQHSRELEREVSGIRPNALEALKRYPWPGNVRELRNLLESLVLFARREEIELDEIPAEYRMGAASTAPQPVRSGEFEPETMAEIEKRAILDTLAYTGGHRAKAAQMLEIGLRTLQRKLKEYGEIKGDDED